MIEVSKLLLNNLILSSALISEGIIDEIVLKTQFSGYKNQWQNDKILNIIFLFFLIINLLLQLEINKIINYTNN